MKDQHHPTPLTASEIDRFKGEWLRVFPPPPEQQAPEAEHKTGPSAVRKLLTELGFRP